MLPALTLALLVTIPAATGPRVDTAKPAKNERESLEQLLARAKAQQELLQQKLAGEVAVVVASLEALESAPNSTALANLDAQLVALGTDATPLLVRYISPGEDALDKERMRALHVAQALARMDTTAITGDLLRVLTDGSSEGKRNALRVLEHTKDPARVRPVVDALFKSSEGTLRQACLHTWVMLGGDTKALLSEVQKSGDENLVAMVLTTMADTRNADAAEFVRSILLDQRRAGQHALELIAYFKELPDLAGDQEVLAFVRLANTTISADLRIAIVDALPTLKPRLSSELRKGLEPIVTSSDRRLSEAGLVALANLGDKGSRKRLIEPYDDRVKQNEEWSQAWVERGDVYVRIADWDAAVKDYVKAIQLGNDDGALRPDTYVKLARAYMRLGKLKEAAYYVGRAPLSMQQRRALSEDPEFKPLRESKYAKEAFGLE